MDISRLFPEDAAGCAEAVALLTATHAVDCPGALLSTPTGYAADLRYGWDLDPGRTYLAREAAPRLPTEREPTVAAGALPGSDASVISQAPGRPQLAELDRLIRSFGHQTDTSPSAAPWWSPVSELGLPAVDRADRRVIAQTCASAASPDDGREAHVCTLTSAFGDVRGVIGGCPPPRVGLSSSGRSMT